MCMSVLGVGTLIYVPSIAPISPGNLDRSSMAAEIIVALSNSGHFINVGVIVNNASVTRLTAQTAVACTTSKRSHQIALST